MGNCLTRCFGRFDKRRKYLNTRYDVEREASIERRLEEARSEVILRRIMKQPSLRYTLVLQNVPFVVGRKRRKFENLMDDDAVQNEMRKLVTEREKQLVSSRQYNTLVQEQRQIDAEIDTKLQREEEELRREEEAYYEAKQEAARIAQLQRAQEEKAKLKTTSNGPKSWPAGEDSDWEVAGGEDDFEKFLEGVKARSLRNTAHLRKTSKDGQSSSSSTPTTQARERSHTDGSNSLDLEWEHEEGMELRTKGRTNTEEELTISTSQSKTGSSKSASPVNSDDLEWDTEFTASEDKDTQSLLKAEIQMGVR